MQHSSGIIPSSVLHNLIEPITTGVVSDPPPHFQSFSLLGKAPMYNQGCCGSCYAVTIATVLTMVCRAKSLDCVVHPLSIMQSSTHYGCLGGTLAGDDVADDLNTIGVSLQSFRGCRLFEASSTTSCADVAHISLESARQVCGHGKHFALCTQGSYFLSDTVCRESISSRLHVLDWVSTLKEDVVQTQVLRHGACATVMSIGREFENFDSDGWLEVSNIDNFTQVYIPLRSATPDTEYHAVTIVGWATVSTDYMQGLVWIVQNSWGSSWGDGGMCLIAASSAKIINSSRSIQGKIFGDTNPDPMIVCSFATNVTVRDGGSLYFTRHSGRREVMPIILWVVAVFGVVWSIMKLSMSGCK